jgi:nucleoside-diphosphate-sugar epimerase
MDFFRKSFQLSTRNAGRILGFEPDIDFAEGVSRTADWYEEKGLI